MPKTKDEKKILKAAGVGEGSIIYRRTKINITEGFSSKPCKLENNAAVPLKY